MPKKITSVEQLAILAQEEFLSLGKKMGAGFQKMDAGFQTMDAGFRTMDAGFQAVDAGFQAVADVLDLIRADLREVKIVLPPLVRSIGGLETEVHDLRGRGARLERRAGLAK